VIELDRAQHMGDLERFADAARSARDRDALVIEQEELAFALDEFGAEIKRVADAQRAGHGPLSLRYSMCFQRRRRAASAASQRARRAAPSHARRSPPRRPPR